MKLLVLLFVLVCAASHAETTLTYPHQSFSDGYPLALLKMALKKAEPETHYRLNESSIETHQGRALKLLAKNVEIDVAWSMTSNAREQELQAIKIPIYKGYFGYRIFLIHRQAQSLFPKDLPLDTLRNERLAVQGHDWPDYEVMRFNGYNIEGIEFYQAMFDLLQKQRADYFPRSILEAFRERNNFQAKNIAIEQNLILTYPAYVFFFVSKQNDALARTIEKGLLLSIDDGSFDVLFDTIEAGALKKAKLSERRIIPLRNPTTSSKGVYQWNTAKTIN